MQLAITAHAMKRAFRRIDTAGARVILLDAGDRVVAAFSEKLSKKVAGDLEALGVTVHEGSRVTAIDERGVTYETGRASERIDARTVIWAAGVHAVPLTESLARATGASTDRGGRIEVNPDLTVPGHPEISVIGDVATLEGPGGKPLPGLATVAIQQAHHVAKAIHAGQARGRARRSSYLDKGALAVVGRGRAVCEIRGLELWGRPAFLTYLGVHLYYLGGQMGRRLEVLIKWIGARFGERQSALIEGELASVERASPARGGDRVGADLFPLAADLGAARSQMAFTLGFHIILASLGVAFPAIILIANYLGLRRNDADALELAQRWSKVAAVLFAVGAVTGTVLSFEMGLLWPEFMSRFGDVFGPAFALEGIFFFTEAIFVAIYIFGWKRLSGWVHFWTGVPIVIAGLGGAWSGRRRQLLDEHAGRLQARRGRHRDRRRSGRRVLQLGGRLRGAAHDPRGVHGRRLPRGLGLRRRHAPRAPRPPSPARPADPVDAGRDRHADPVRASATPPPARSPRTSRSSSRRWSACRRPRRT